MDFDDTVTAEIEDGTVDGSSRHPVLVGESGLRWEFVAGLPFAGGDAGAEKVGDLAEGGAGRLDVAHDAISCQTSNFYEWSDMSHDPGANSGCINWPTHLRDSGEGGMWVHALVLAGKDRSARHGDTFVNCCEVEGTIALPQANVCSSDNRGLYMAPEVEYGHDDYDMQVMTSGPTVLAALCLGTSGGSWSYLGDEVRGEYGEYEADMRRRGDDVYWQCREEDLTPDGVALVESLRKLYGRDVELVTYLDT